MHRLLKLAICLTLIFQLSPAFADSKLANNESKVSQLAATLHTVLLLERAGYNFPEVEVVRGEVQLSQLTDYTLVVIEGRIVDIASIRNGDGTISDDFRDYRFFNFSGNNQRLPTVGYFINNRQLHLNGYATIPRLLKKLTEAISQSELTEAALNVNQFNINKVARQLLSRKRLIMNDSMSRSEIEAAFEKGLQYKKEGRDKERIQAFMLAGEEGHALAQLGVGTGYILGRGIEKDASKAAYWWRLSAEQGQRSAQNNLGVLYRKGEGVPQDYAKALYWCSKSANQGWHMGQYCLGLLYKDGLGVPQDVIEAMAWWVISYEAGNPKAKYALMTTGEGMSKEMLSKIDVRAEQLKKMLPKK